MSRKPSVWRKKFSWRTNGASARSNSCHLTAAFSRSASMAKTSTPRNRRANSPISMRWSNNSNRAPDAPLQCAILGTPEKTVGGAFLPRPIATGMSLLRRVLFGADGTRAVQNGESWVSGDPRGLQNRCPAAMRRGVGSIPTLSANFSAHNRPRRRSRPRPRMILTKGGDACVA